MNARRFLILLSEVPFIETISATLSIDYPLLIPFPCSAALSLTSAPSFGSFSLHSGADAIIRQHKAACLRITALLACKDLLWIGTSAGENTLPFYPLRHQLVGRDLTFTDKTAFLTLYVLGVFLAAFFLNVLTSAKNVKSSIMFV